jgi:small subunit ribosomal protein S17|tara:strand:- start:16927 stop:17472 length:546 start_codon:yes stop_codon:yes gene_type:complete
MSQKKTETKNKEVGMGLKAPNKKCEDNKCPFHGSIKLRGRVFIGVLTSKDTHQTATVVWKRREYVPKYERYLKKRSKLRVHNPSCINAKEGDFVKIVECKPLSKTKKFVIVEKLGEDVMFEQREEALESSKVMKDKKEEPEETKEEIKETKKEVKTEEKKVKEEKKEEKADKTNKNKEESE